MLLSEGSIVRSYPMAVVGIFARLHLVDEITNCKGMILGGAEHQRLFCLVDLVLDRKFNFPYSK